MKTSNRLLLGLCAFIGLTLISGMGVAKKNMIIEEAGGKMTTNQPESQVLLESYESSTLILEQSLVDQYTLDPSLTNISVNADAEFTERLRISDNGKIKFYTEGNRGLEMKSNKPVVVTIGTMDKESLSIHLGHKAMLDNVDYLKSDLSLYIEDRASAVIRYEGEELQVLLSDKAHLKLEGAAETCSVQAEDKSSLSGSQFITENLTLEMKNSSSVKINKATRVDGSIEDDATLRFEELSETDQLSRADRAEVFFGHKKG